MTKHDQLKAPAVAKATDSGSVMPLNTPMGLTASRWATQPGPAPKQVPQVKGRKPDTNKSSRVNTSKPAAHLKTSPGVDELVSSKATKRHTLQPKVHMKKADSIVTPAGLATSRWASLEPKNTHQKAKLPAEASKEAVTQPRPKAVVQPKKASPQKIDKVVSPPKSEVSQPKNVPEPPAPKRGGDWANIFDDEQFENDADYRSTIHLCSDGGRRKGKHLI